jgi:biofilm PGA synthesis protein PgaA
MKATGELISSPINHLFHLSFQGSYSWSELPEGEESLSRYGGGIEYIGEQLSVLALINYNDSTVEETGGVLRGNWSPDDHWSLRLQGERFSDATPLRALFYGIREDRIIGSGAYRWNESRSLYMSLSSGWFTDDNHRVEGSVSFTERLIDEPRFDLDLILDLYGSTNSRDNAPYFNPQEDLSGKGVIKAEHIIYRLYETSLSQQVTAGLGVYAQENYSTGITGKLGYELRLRYHPRIEATLGGELGQNRYDGEDEPYYKFNFLIHGKF